VLESTIFTLLRPIQQYNIQTPFEPDQTAQIVQRVLILARAWENLHAESVSLSTLASSQTLLGASTIKSTFYSKASSSSKSVSLDISGPSNIYDKLAQIAEESDMPMEDQYRTLIRVRVQIALNNPSQRQQLLRVRLMALSAYGESFYAQC
jgi:hypothetical protein